MIILASCLQSWAVKTRWLAPDAAALYMEVDDLNKKFVSYVSDSSTSAVLTGHLFANILW